MVVTRVWFLILSVAVKKKQVVEFLFYISFSLQVYEESMLRVPVGLREHSSLVCALTLLTTGLCSGLILAAACKYGHFSQ